MYDINLQCIKYEMYIYLMPLMQSCTVFNLLIHVQHGYLNCLTLKPTGESRTGQLNTLQITLQAIPQDSAVCLAWHEPLVCTGPGACMSMQETTCTRQARL